MRLFLLLLFLWLLFLWLLLLLLYLLLLLLLLLLFRLLLRRLASFFSCCCCCCCCFCCCCCCLLLLPLTSCRGTQESLAGGPCCATSPSLGQSKLQHQAQENRGGGNDVLLLLGGLALQEVHPLQHLCHSVGKRGHG